MNRELMLGAAAEIKQDAVPTLIFNRHAPALYKYAFRLFQNAVVADRLVGNTFARFVERSSWRRQSEINLRLELYAIAYDILASDVRYSDFFTPVVTKIPKYVDYSSTTLDLEGQQVFENIYRSLIHDLTNDQRHVVMLRFMEGFSVKETALITGKKVGTVKVIQNRGMAVLRKALDAGAVETQTIALFIRRLAHA